MAAAALRDLTGRVAVVTASTDGIGLAIARRLGQQGAKVVISSRKQENVDQALHTLKGEGLTVSGRVCHVAKQSHRQALFEHTIDQYGKLDILVSNAATNPVFGPCLDTSEEAWDKILHTNVTASFLLCQQAMPHLVASKNGSVVIVSSIAGLAPFPLLGPYSVSKTALLGLTKVLGTECAAQGVRVNCVAPGVIETRFSEQLWKSEQAAKSALKGIPLNRFGKPEDCAGLVSFLASDDSSYITGETIVCAGGMQSRL